MDWSKQNVLITGCTGFLGYHLLKEVLREGAYVIGTYRTTMPRKNFILSQTERLTLIQANLEDEIAVERIISKYKINTVFHLGAQTDVQVAYKNPVDTFRSNIMATWNILESCRHSKDIRQVVIASSDKAYGSANQLPYTENMPLFGRYPYDVSKSASDMIAQSYFHTYGLPVCVTRCGNLYGEGDLNFSRIVPGTIKSIIKGDLIIIRSNGKYTRDYLYVKDAVRAYMALVQGMAVDKKVLGHAFNFSNDNPLSVLDLVNKIRHISGKDTKPPTILNEVEDEIIHQHLSNEKSKKLLGWKPIYSLEESMQETISWYDQFFREESILS